ncbi:MAG: DUF4142 domain-containing protein, partial [Nitrospira sp.]|nr:DUF4142 domain-containing protein [Nitrospira sp.]
MAGIRSVTLWAISVVPFVSVTGIFGGPPASQSDMQSVLDKSAAEVQVEISLGQLAVQRARNEQVKEFGQHMVEDHKKVSHQIELLALKQGITLSPGHRDEHQQKLEKKLEALSK